jgi:hypothetical protein
VWIVFYLNDITGVSFSEAGSQLAIAAKRREFEIRGYRVLFRPGERRGSKSAS